MILYFEIRKNKLVHFLFITFSRLNGTISVTPIVKYSLSFHFGRKSLDDIFSAEHNTSKSPSFHFYRKSLCSESFLVCLGFSPLLLFAYLIFSKIDLNFYGLFFILLLNSKPKRLITAAFYPVKCN